MHNASIQGEWMGGLKTWNLISPIYVDHWFDSTNSSHFSYSHIITALCEFYMSFEDLIQRIFHKFHWNWFKPTKMQKIVIFVQIEEVDINFAFIFREERRRDYRVWEKQQGSEVFFLQSLYNSVLISSASTGQRNIQNPPWILVRQMSVWSLSHKERVWLYRTTATAWRLLRWQLMCIFWYCKLTAL